MNDDGDQPKRELPQAAGAFTERQRDKLARLLPWLPEGAEIGARLETLQQWALAEAEDIATRGDGVTAPSVLALLNEAANDLAHAGELRKIAMKSLRKGGDKGEHLYAKYIGLASRLGDAAGLHMMKARTIAMQAKSKATWKDPTEALLTRRAGDLSDACKREEELARSGEDDET